MSDCGVCLSTYEGDTEMYRRRICRAGKLWKCEECGKRIERGVLYELSGGKTEGNFWACKTCLVCSDIANGLSCNGRCHGNLWDDMEYIYENLNTACFSRLSTIEGKKELQRRWMIWKGLV